MGEIEIVPLEEARRRLGDEQLAPRLAELKGLCFSTFEGVAWPTLAATRWYLARPGLDPALGRAALLGDRLIGNAYVTRLTFPVGGRALRVGMFDTVMTHPAHRQQGIARRMLSAALAELAARGWDAAALYTAPGSLPYGLYARLGFQPHRASVIWRRERAGGEAPEGWAVRALAPEEQEPARALANRAHAGEDGFVPVDEALWRWRKWERPAERPARVLGAWQGERLAATVTLCPLEVVTSHGPERSTYWVDLALEPGDEGPALRALLAAEAAPPLLALAGEDDARLAGLLAGEGFSPAPGEVCMLYPLADAARVALEAPRRPWHALIESVVGI